MQFTDLCNISSYNTFSSILNILTAVNNELLISPVLYPVINTPLNIQLKMTIYYENLTDRISSVEVFNEGSQVNPGVHDVLANFNSIATKAFLVLNTFLLNSPSIDIYDIRKLEIVTTCSFKGGVPLNPEKTLWRVYRIEQHYTHM